MKVEFTRSSWIDPKTRKQVVRSSCVHDGIEHSLQMQMVRKGEGEEDYYAFLEQKLALAIHLKVSKEAIKQSTKASAKLEGRELPANYVRSEAVERFLVKRHKI